MENHIFSIDWRKMEVGRDSCLKSERTRNYNRNLYILHWLAQDGSWQRHYLKISTNLWLQLLLDKLLLLKLIHLFARKVLLVFSFYNCWFFFMSNFFITKTLLANRLMRKKNLLSLINLYHHLPLSFEGSYKFWLNKIIHFTLIGARLKLSKTHNLSLDR